MGCLCKSQVYQWVYLKKLCFGVPVILSCVHEEAMGGQKSDFTLKLVDHQKPSKGLYHAKTD